MRQMTPGEVTAHIKVESERRLRKVFGTRAVTRESPLLKRCKNERNRIFQYRGEKLFLVEFIFRYE